jgi:hypothetical protein
MPSVLELNAVMPEQREFQPSSTTELVGSAAVHAQVLMQCIIADHVIAVQPPQQSQTPDNMSDPEAAKSDFMHQTMFSVYQAHEHVQHPSRISHITFGAQQSATCIDSSQKSHGYQQHQHANCWLKTAAAAASISLARTLFMEHRAKSGVILDMWPPELPVNAQVIYIGMLCWTQKPYMLQCCCIHQLP